MPDLNFKVTGIEPAQRGLAPLLHFILEITNTPETETIQSVMLQTQIQIQAPQRVYDAEEKKKLKELFGAPEDWGQTLRTRLWTHANTIVPQFRGDTKQTWLCPARSSTSLPRNIFTRCRTAKSHSLPFQWNRFLRRPGWWTADPKISRKKECTWHMRIAGWQELMEHHYPNSAWIAMCRDVFDQLYEFKRREGLSSWDEVLERLLTPNGSVAK